MQFSISSNTSLIYLISEENQKQFEDSLQVSTTVDLETSYLGLKNEILTLPQQQHEMKSSSKAKKEYPNEVHKAPLTAKPRLNLDRSEIIHQQRLAATNNHNSTPSSASHNNFLQPKPNTRITEDGGFYLQIETGKTRRAASLRLRYHTSRMPRSSPRSFLCGSGLATKLSHACVTKHQHHHYRHRPAS